MTDTPEPTPIRLALPGGGMAELPPFTDTEVVRQLRTLLTQVLTWQSPNPIDPSALNTALVHAVGLDPEKVVGFRLTVEGGTLPHLEVWMAPPGTDGALDDRWVEPITAAAADVTMVVLPGGDKEAPLAKPRHAAQSPDAELANTLEMLADVINGAGCTPAMRNQLTLAARRHAELIADGIYPQFPGQETTNG